MEIFFDFKLFSDQICSLLSGFRFILAKREFNGLYGFQFVNNQVQKVAKN